MCIVYRDTKNHASVFRGIKKASQSPTIVGESEAQHEKITLSQSIGERLGESVHLLRGYNCPVVDVIRIVFVQL